MYLRNVGSEGNSWYGKFTTDVLSNPNFDQLQLRIYPNPTNSELVTIQSPVSGDKNIKLFDINGRLVLNKNLNSDYLNIDSIESGMYFVQVTVEGKISTSKLIVH